MTAERSLVRNNHDSEVNNGCATDRVEWDEGCKEPTSSVVIIKGPPTLKASHWWCLCLVCIINMFEVN